MKTYTQEEVDQIIADTKKLAQEAGMELASRLVMEQAAMAFADKSDDKALLLRSIAHAIKDFKIT
jgi:hypothetical protein